MKKLIAILLMLVMLFGMADARVYDIKNLLGGNDEINWGAPWIGDDLPMYFGHGKDFKMIYDSDMDTLYLNDTPLYLEEAVTFGGGTTITTSSFTTIGVTTGINDNGYAYVGGLLMGANAKVNGTTYSVGALTTNALLTAANIKGNGTLYNVGAVTGNGQITGANIKSNATIYAVTTLNSGGTATLNALNVNGTASAADLSATDDLNVASHAQLAEAAVTGLLSSANSKINGTTYSVGAVSTDGLLTAANIKGNGTLYNVGTITGNGQLTAATIKANTSIYTADTLNSGGIATVGALVVNGTSTFNGSPTVATGDTLAVTDADKLTVGGIIVPQEMSITVPIAAASVDQFVFTATEKWNITSIRENHAVAGDAAVPNEPNLTIKICDDTEAPSAGVIVHDTPINLKASAATIIKPVLGALNLTVNVDDSIALDFSGTLTNLAGGSITIDLKRMV